MNHQSSCDKMKDARLAAAAGLAAGVVLHAVYTRWRKARDDLVEEHELNSDGFVTFRNAPPAGARDADGTVSPDDPVLHVDAVKEHVFERPSAGTAVVDFDFLEGFMRLGRRPEWCHGAAGRARKARMLKIRSIVRRVSCGRDETSARCDASSDWAAAGGRALASCTQPLRLCRRRRRVDCWHLKTARATSHAACARA